MRITWYKPDGTAGILHSDGPVAVGPCQMAVAHIAGAGMPPLRFLQEQGPYQHGKTLLGRRLEPRTISLQLVFASDDLTGPFDTDPLLVAARRTLAGWFNPYSAGNRPGRLRWSDVELGVTVAREIEAVFAGRLDFDALPGEGNQIIVPVDLYCPDPLWYDPALQSHTFALESLNQLVFPIEFPIVFGSGIIAETESMTNAGDWSEFPVIIIDGPANEVEIENGTTSEKLALTGGGGYNIAAGERVTFDTRYGKKTVKNGSNTNLIGYLSTDSDIDSFHLAADAEVDATGNHVAAGGVNEITVSAAGCTVATAIQVQWYNRYLTL